MIELTNQTVLALVTLTAMEIVLGIDNIIFIAILVARLPEEQQAKVRSIGISLALIIRILLLLSISWIMTLKEPLFSILEYSFSGRDLILLGGGLFLIAKSTFEIHHKVEGDPEIHLPDAGKKKRVSAGLMLFQILILDIVFSLDSVITAVGMANQVSIMVIAMVVSMIVMLLSAGKISGFVEKHPTIKILALSFLLLIGVMLVAEALGSHVSKGYIYFAMAFSLIVEMLNIRYRLKNSHSKK
jgi:predicted tellurium resistance membrane protein TerC